MCKGALAQLDIFRMLKVTLPPIKDHSSNSFVVDLTALGVATLVLGMADSLSRCSCFCAGNSRPSLDRCDNSS